MRSVSSPSSSSASHQNQHQRSPQPGPLDGSLYARIAKRGRRSPTAVTFRLPNGTQLSPGTSSGPSSLEHQQQQQDSLSRFKSEAEGRTHTLAPESPPDTPPSTDTILLNTHLNTHQAFAPLSSPVTSSSVASQTHHHNNSSIPEHSASADSGISMSHHPHAHHHHVSHAHVTSPRTVQSVQAEVHRPTIARSPSPTPQAKTSHVTAQEQAQLDQLLADMLFCAQSLPDRPTVPVVPMKRTVQRSTSQESSKQPSSSSYSAIPSTQAAPAQPQQASVSNQTSNSNYDTQYPTFKMVTDKRNPLEATLPPPKSAIVPLPARLLTRPPPQRLDSGEPLPDTAADEWDPEDLEREREERENRRPLHARTTAKPFSYGVTESSPSLARRRRRVLSEQSEQSSAASEPTWQQERDEVDESAGYGRLGGGRAYASFGGPGSSRRGAGYGGRDIQSDSEDLLPSYPGDRRGWLERQQNKLKSKKVGREFGERLTRERALMDELKMGIRGRKEPSTSRETSKSPTRAPDPPSLSRAVPLRVEVHDTAVPQQPQRPTTPKSPIPIIRIEPTSEQGSEAQDRSERSSMVSEPVRFVSHHHPAPLSKSASSGTVPGRMIAPGGGVPLPGLTRHHSTTTYDRGAGGDFSRRGGTSADARPGRPWSPPYSTIQRNTNVIVGGPTYVPFSRATGARPGGQPNVSSQESGLVQVYDPQKQANLGRDQYGGLLTTTKSSSQPTHSTPYKSLGMPYVNIRTPGKSSYNIRNQGGGGESSIELTFSPILGKTASAGGGAGREGRDREGGVTPAQQGVRGGGGGHSSGVSSSGARSTSPVGSLYATIGGAEVPLSKSASRDFHPNQQLSKHESQERVQEVLPGGGTPMFVHDTSKWWYKPAIGRNEAIDLLKNKPAGTFLVRDSANFPGSFGLALKVARENLPAGIQTTLGPDSSDLVRFYLIETTPRGVRLKGSPDEPVFPTLAALVYHHSLERLSLPCLLRLPNRELTVGPDMTQLWGPQSTGLARAGYLAPYAGGGHNTEEVSYNCLFLITVDMESLTGPHALRRAVHQVLSMRPPSIPTIVHFKISPGGITLTDVKHRLFFRRHYPMSKLTYCDLDPDNRSWTLDRTTDASQPQYHSRDQVTLPPGRSRLFGFVARKAASRTDNQCHVFTEYTVGGPATEIVALVNKYLNSSSSAAYGELSGGESLKRVAR